METRHRIAYIGKQSSLTAPAWECISLVALCVTNTPGTKRRPIPLTPKDANLVIIVSAHHLPNDVASDSTQRGLSTIWTRIGWHSIIYNYYLSTEEDVQDGRSANWLNSSQWTLTRGNIVQHRFSWRRTVLLQASILMPSLKLYYGRHRTAISTSIWYRCRLKCNMKALSAPHMHGFHHIVWVFFSTSK